MKVDVLSIKIYTVFWGKLDTTEALTFEFSVVWFGFENFYSITKICGGDQNSVEAPDLPTSCVATMVKSLAMIVKPHKTYLKAGSTHYKAFFCTNYPANFGCLSVHFLSGSRNRYLLPLVYYTIQV